MRQLVSQFRKQLGWQGMSGIALLALAGAFLILALRPLEQETAFMHKHLTVAREKAAMQASTIGLDDRQQELVLFLNSLPVEEDVTDILASIYSIAEATGVEYKQAEYHLSDKDKPRLEYGIVFPVRGEYSKIRFFVARVLADHRTIALDQVNFQRDKINDPILKAEIRLTLFLKPFKQN